jgi:acyl-CoA thioester hydrolase
MRELWRGEAGVFDCDPAGRLRLSVLYSRAREALDSLAAEIGLANLENARATSALMPRAVAFEGLARVESRATLAIQGGIARFDEAGLLARLELREGGGDRPAARIAIEADHIETASARVFPWPDRMREAAQDLLIKGTRTRDPAPGRLNEPITLERADALGMAETGRGALRAAEGDAFGRARLAALLARLAAGGSWPLEEHDPEAGPAWRDARIVVHRRPSAGDRFLVRSAIARMDGASWREARWLIAPARGSAWASLEGARDWVAHGTGRAVELPDALRAALERAPRL